VRRTRSRFVNFSTDFSLNLATTCEWKGIFETFPFRDYLTEKPQNRRVK